MADDSPSGSLSFSPLVSSRHSGKALFAAFVFAVARSTLRMMVMMAVLGMSWTLALHTYAFHAARLTPARAGNDAPVDKHER